MSTQSANILVCNSSRQDNRPVWFSHSYLTLFVIEVKGFFFETGCQLMIFILRNIHKKNCNQYISEQNSKRSHRRPHSSSRAAKESTFDLITPIMSLIRLIFYVRPTRRGNMSEHVHHIHPANQNRVEHTFSISKIIPRLTFSL